jgi:hypothetical protein
MVRSQWHVASDRLHSGHTISGRGRFRPRITTDENGKVEGFEGFAQLEAPYICSQFVVNPYAF